LRALVKPSRERWALLPLAALCAFVAACQSGSGTNGSGAAASPTPSAAATVADLGTTNALPQNCVRQTQAFRFTDARTGQPMPYMQNYTPWPSVFGANVEYQLQVPTPPPANQTPIAVEVPPGTKGSKQNPLYLAAPVVPIMILSVVYGLESTSDVLLVPSGPPGPGNISTEYQQDLKYQAAQETMSQEYTYAQQAGKNPTPMPVDSAGAAMDKQFQELGVPALNAISVGAQADDRFFKGYTTNGGPTQNADPHPRIITCDWLQDRPYDVFVSILQKRLLPPAQLAALQTQLRAQEAPSPMLTSAGYVPFEKDTYVFPAVKPQLIAPTIATSLGQGTIDNTAVILLSKPLPLTSAYLITHVQIPAPDDTAPP
jgi:hypothetical protein